MANKPIASESGCIGRPGPIRTAVGPQDPKTGKYVMRVGKYVEIQLVEIPRDGQQGGKLKLAKLSNALLLQAHKIGVPIAGVAGVLGSMIEGRGLYLDSVGEFFQLYGQFEQLLGLTDDYGQRKIERAMLDRLRDDATQHCREYIRSGRKSLTPLPLYVRNVLAHQGTNQANGLADGDLNTAIRLLRDWLQEAIEARPDERGDETRQG